MITFNRFLLVIVLSFSALQAKGLDEIAHLPHAQEFITKVLKTRNLNPNDFSIKIIEREDKSLIRSFYSERSPGLKARASRLRSY